ncbi:hypothetical protein Forpi1262_v005327 [Fusarium oxysporum f. sp. raphani]|uniref:HNH nuclease domain-containing protein n=1 Tax=Fusarium oxysporum f. sp. raphani TaxID=96318 RepID=A0A8J5UP35_FUSOX|nr:hypothetical protein Forpi1262_v005327 [Fusarium oxysporum f. sp. raphani]
MPPHLTSYQSLVTSKARRRSKPDERPKAPRSETLIPLEEYQLRLEFIDEIRKASQRFRSPKRPDLTGLEFSYIINIPIDSLRVLKGSLGVMASSVQANINNSRNATGRLLQKAAYKIEFPEEYQNNSSTKTDSEAGREDNVWKRCLKLDGDCCVITGASHPHVYQILPFAWSKTKANLRTQQMIPALEVVVDLKPSNVKYEAVTKLRQGVGCTDSLWNVVCLSIQLHKWWDHAYFGQKYDGRANCLEEDFAQIHLQFLWMPRNIYRWATKQRVQRKAEVRISHRFAQSTAVA